MEIEFNPETSTTEGIMTMSLVPTYCEVLPEATVETMTFGTPIGNARIAGPAINDIAAAAATRKLIITAEEIVSNVDMRWNNKGVVIPFQNVDAVVELPYGALPGYMPGAYYWARRW